VLLEEAVEVFPHRYMELPSTTEEDKQTNESILLKWVQYIIKNNTRT